MISPSTRTYTLLHRGPGYWGSRGEAYRVNWFDDVSRYTHYADYLYLHCGNTCNFTGEKIGTGHLRCCRRIIYITDNRAIRQIDKQIGPTYSPFTIINIYKQQIDSKSDSVKYPRNITNITITSPYFFLISDR